MERGTYRAQDGARDDVIAAATITCCGQHDGKAQIARVEAAAAKEEKSAEKAVGGHTHVRWWWGKTDQYTCFLLESASPNTSFAAQSERCPVPLFALLLKWKKMCGWMRKCRCQRPGLPHRAQRRAEILHGSGSRQGVEVASCKPEPQHAKLLACGTRLHNGGRWSRSILKKTAINGRLLYDCSQNKHRSQNPTDSTSPF